MTQTIWNIFVELRKELVEAQKMRAQVMGFKVTFVMATIGLLAANIDKINKTLFVIPAFAAICFDFIICSYSFSIKRIGSYTQHHIEPALKQAGDVPDDFVFWQHYLTQPKTRQRLSFYGNVGLTLLVVMVGLVGLWIPPNSAISYIISFVLFLFILLDIFAYREPKKLGKLWATKDFNN